MRREPLRYLVVVLGLAVAACSNNPPPPLTQPPISFNDAKPFVFDVARVEIVTKFVTPSTPPHIEFQLAVSPENAAKRWVQDRLQPKGTAGILRVVINDASATETNIPKDPNKSVLDLNNVDQTRIDMSLDVALQILDDRQFVTAEVTGKASRSRSLPTGIKLNERDKILHDMVIDLVRGWGQEVDPQIHNTFPKSVLVQRRSPPLGL